MRTVVAPIRHLRSMLVSNVFLLDGGRGDRWLIDCGHVTERLTLLLELRSAGLGPRDLTGVLLTHRHSDHAGNAAFLQRHGVAIHAHEADADVLAGKARREPLTRGGGSALAGLLAKVENHFPAESLVVDRALRDGDAIAGMEVHWVPGHTRGSVFYRHESTKALMSGDTLLTAHPPLTLRGGLATAYPTFTTDMELAHASLHAFHSKNVEYNHLLAGHGRPLLGDARRKVLAFLEDRAGSG